MHVPGNQPFIGTWSYVTTLAHWEVIWEPLWSIWYELVQIGRYSKIVIKENCDAAQEICDQIKVVQLLRFNANLPMMTMLSV